MIQNAGTFGDLVSSKRKRALREDEQLVREVVEGQTASFELLVRKYQDRLYNTLVHVTGSTHEAEEVVQDAMLQAYTKLSTFKGKSSFYTWLYRIAFNLSISRQRKKRPRISLDGLHESGGLDPEDTVDQPDDRATRMEQAAQVHKALEKLGEEYRSVLVLREMENCDYETIAEMLSVPVGTVRSRLHRARTMLRDRLREAIGETE